MRTAGAATLVAAVALGCGGTNGGGNGSGGSAKRTLQIHVSGNGQVQSSAFSCRNDCPEQLNDGQAVHLDAVADSGWKFDGWQGDCSGTGGCDLTMSADHKVTASFSAAVGATVRVDVKTVGDGTGRLTSSPPGIDCPGACSMTVATGTAVTLSANAGANSTFAGFGGVCGGAACNFTASSDSVAWANFTANPPPPPVRHTLTVVVDGQGRVTSSPAGIACSGATCSSQFDPGASVTLTAAAATSWTFASWSGACSGAAGCALTMNSDAQVTAHFNAPPPPPATAHVIVAVSGRGQVTGVGIVCGLGATTCDTTVAASASVTLNAAAASQARFMGWSGACSGANSSCTLTMVNGDVRVGASFEDNVVTLVANDGTNQTGLAINSTDAFYARYTNADGGSIWAVSKSGGQPRRVASGIGQSFVADDNYVYWADYYSISSAPVQGGQASLIFASRPGIGRLALDAGGALYFTASNYSYSSSPGGEVHRMQNRTDTVLASGLSVHPGVGVDDTYVYFGVAEGHGMLKRVPITGGAVETLVNCSTDCWITAIRADSKYVYFRAQSGQAWSLSKASPTLVLLSASNGTAWYNPSNEIDVWGSTAYWNFVWPQSGASGIFSAQADGSHWTAIDTSTDWQWYGPRVDEKAIYDWHVGSLIRRLK